MGLGIKTKLRSFLEGQLNRQYADRLAKAKRRITYEEWLQQREGRDSAARQEQGNRLLRERGIWLIRQRDGYVDPRAFSWIADYFREHPEVQLLYGDEDALDVTGEHRCSPCFRPQWSPDTWLSAFYLGSVIALRWELAGQLPEGMWPGDSEGTLYFDEPSQVRLLVHRLLKLAGGFERGCGAIAHLPKVLFHMNHEAAGKGVCGQYLREDRLEWPPRDRQTPMVSIVIPSKDNPRVLEQCLESLRKSRETAAGEETQCCQLEILVVDNGSSPENRAEIEKITRGMKYIYEPMTFNFSKMCNRGAQEATGDVLLFLNDDITVCADGWLEAMADRALRPYVGAVGLKLYYPDSTRIQHVGIANLPGGPVHKLQFTQDGQEEDHGYSSLDRNVIGVTGACLMVERERFWQAGGFPEDLQVAYNDVELCFRLRENGWHNMVVNAFHAYHHESLSRGNDLTREKMLRLRRERQTLYERHPQYLNRDPYYPEPLCMELGDTHIYENYLDIRTDPQTISRLRWQAECPEQEPENLICEVQLSRAIGRRASKSQDSLCLQGYVVVKWENNDCYERWLLLREQRETVGAHMVRLEMKYSGEAEYGMQEQPNVAMCGFWVLPERGVLPDGSYRIGVQACSRIGRRRLTVWTEQWVQVRNGIFEAVEELDTDSRAERNA
ncbi:MAG: glycosyltransferase [Acetatifactor sp.]|nr:glycosyltransferase [Acetatifactor sp.]